MVSSPSLRFWFEFASSYSYPAAARVAQLVRCGAATVEYRPFLLGPIFAAQGWQDSPFNLYPAKGRYMWRDLARRCDALGLPLSRPEVFPQNGLLAARLCTALGDAPQLPELVLAIYGANFADGQDVSDPATLRGIARDASLDADALLAAAADPATKATLRERTETATALGIFGSPTFVAGEDLFWGEDRLDAALRHVDVPCALPGVRIRPFDRGDTDAVVQLWRDAGLVVPHNDPHADIDTKLTIQPESFLVALRHDAIVGSCMAGFDGHRGWLNYLATAGQHRAEGIGRALVEAAEARLRAAGCPKVNLVVRAHNDAVVGFYESLGYTREDRSNLGKRLEATARRPAGG